MNKRAITPITIAFWALMFLIFWFMFLGSFVNLGVGMAIENNHLTGIEALILGNLNLIIFFCFIIFIVAYTYFAGGN